MNDILEYFGIDLGDGESAVAWLRAGASGDAMMLEIAGRKNILSAIGEAEDGSVLIGEAACIAYPDKLYVRFKSGFLTDRQAASERIRLFAKKLLEELKNGGKPENTDSAAFFIGCPSGWNDQARDAYKRLFEQAGFRNITLISESRAAFLFARESGELGITERSLNRPTLIIDAGSSTTDFTFVDQLRTQRVFDFGETRMGGGLIDRALWERNLKRHPEAGRIREILEKCPQYEARCELEARKVKEMFFSRLAQGARGAYPCESSVKIYYDKPYIAVDITCDDEDMDRILHEPLEELAGISFLSAYEKRLEETRQALSDTPPETILLTGGASRMGFIGDIARRVFQNATVIRGAEPEFSIARGLCYAARVDFRTAAFERDMEKLISSDRIEQIVTKRLNDLYREVAPAIAEELLDRAAPDAFHAWKSGMIGTIDQMGSAIESALVESMSNGQLKERLAQPARNWLDRLRPFLEQETDPICEKCGLPPASLRLPAFEPIEGGQFSIDSNRIVDLSSLTNIVDVVVATIVASILGGGGVALIMAGPVAWIVSFAVSWFASHAGSAFARKKLEKADLPPFVRALFPEILFRKRMEAQKGEMTLGIQAQLQQGIEEHDEQTRKTVQEISAAVETQLSQIARQARMMIR